MQFYSHERHISRHLCASIFVSSRHLASFCDMAELRCAYMVGKLDLVAFHIFVSFFLYMFTDMWKHFSYKSSMHAFMFESTHKLISQYMGLWMQLWLLCTFSPVFYTCYERYIETIRAYLFSVGGGGDAWITALEQQANKISFNFIILLSVLDSCFKIVSPHDIQIEYFLVQL